MQTSDTSTQPQSARLEDHVRSLYYELRLAGQTPVAVVGSGLSIVYGGVSWADAVGLALVEAKRELEARLRPPAPGSRAVADLSPRDRSRIERALAGITAMSADDALKDGGDYYLALDLCEAAFGLLEDGGRPPSAKGDSRFRRFMQRIFLNDDHVVADNIRKRLALAGSTTELLETLEPGRNGGIRVCIQQIACRLYSWETLERLSLGVPDLQRLYKRLNDAAVRGAAAAQGPLPMDRRSLLCLFLADKTDVEKRALYERIFKAVRSNVRAKRPPVLPPARPLIDPIEALYHRLGIRRFITLNFDFELENSLMIDDIRATTARPHGVMEEIKTGLLRRENFIVDNRVKEDAETDAITRRFTDGLAASTDIYSETSVARLFEFALNSPDYRVQILHLHGRADKPVSMLLTEDDLNRVYRRDRGARTMLEHGLDVAMTGNPILFVGIGLTEQEITRALRQLVSEGRVTPTNPAFAIMAFDRGRTGKGDHGGTESWRKQMSLFRQYGIHLIDAGHARHDGPDFSLMRHLNGLRELRKEVGEEGAERSSMTAAALERACQGLGLIREMPFDAEGFEHVWTAIVAGVKDREATGAPPPWTPELASRNQHLRDYLDKLDSKLRSVVLEREVGRLERGFRDYAARASLVVDGDKPNYKARERTYEPMQQGGVRVRHKVQLPPDPIAVSDVENASEKECEEAAERSRQLQAFVSAVAGCGLGNWSLLAPLGAAKGHVVRQLIARWGVSETPALIVNCNFALEFESAVYQVLRFVWTHSNLHGDAVPQIDRMAAIKRALDSGVDSARAKPPAPPTILISGIERLIDSRARPLTAELEILLALFAETDPAKGWRILVVGTPECRPFVAKPEPYVFQPIEATWPHKALEASGLVPFLRNAAISATTDEALRTRLSDTRFRSPEHLMPNGARSQASQELVRLVLERWHDIGFNDDPHSAARKRLCAEFGKAILGTLAFIGMPVEVRVLEFVPELRRRADEILALPETEEGETRACVFQTAIDRLCRFGLVLTLAPFPTKPDAVESASPERVEPPQRVVLHRIILSEVRDRYGVRSGEEMLSNSFSLTLALSMPTDLAVADIDIHDELKSVVGHLRGAWKDTPLPGEVAPAFAELRHLAGLEDAESDMSLRAENAALSECIARLERNVCILATPMEATLRAAIGIVRGFFSAASLVAMIPEHTMLQDGQSGEFEEHKRRIAQLLRRAREVQGTLRAIRADLFALQRGFKWTDVDASQTTQVRRCRKFIRAYAKREAASQSQSTALYSGELVWLLNEHAVIALLQGDLYTAQRQFAEAERALKTYKGIGVGQTWRRIEINRALLLVERGHITRARASLSQIRSKLDHSPRATCEDELTAPLITGYLGLCDFLSGSYKSAEAKFDQAIKDLVETDQQRALALFYWRRSELALNLDDKAAAKKSIQLSLGAAEAGRQMDVVWRARLTETQVLDNTDPRKETIFREALAYANYMELPRVSVMALSRHAGHKLTMGDVDAAALLATQAMTMAANFGMTLSRISLRILMGSIQLQRGDPSGEYLLRRAIAHADRIGYQLQVERANNVLLNHKARRRNG